MFEDLIKKKVSAEKIVKKIMKNASTTAKTADKIQKKINKIWGNQGRIWGNRKGQPVKSDAKKNLYEKIRRGRDEKSIDSSSTPGR